VKARKKRKVTKTKKKDIGSPIYKISGLKGDWIKHMVEVPPHKLKSYLADLERVHGKKGVIQIDNKFYIKRTWGERGQIHFATPDLPDFGVQKLQISKRKKRGKQTTLNTPPIRRKRRKEDVIDDILSETQIKKIPEAHRAMVVIWDNMDKISNMKRLIEAGDSRWNTSTSKYVSANYDKLVKLVKKAKRKV